MFKVTDTSIQSVWRSPVTTRSAASSARLTLLVVASLFSFLRYLALPLCSSPAHAAEAQPVASDKSGFTLFNPTPKDLMRDLSTDRPDFTESPYTVDAGHFQVELSFLEYARNHDEGGVDTYTALPTNLKLGLLNRLDLQFVFNPYVRLMTDEETLEGFGDVQLRSKVNLWGNDTGTTALGLMPFVQLPTAAEGLGSDRVEGGLMVPFAWELPRGWSLGLMAELDVVRNQSNDDYGIEFVHTAAVGREIAGPLGGYVEYIGLAPHRTGGRYQAMIGLGLTFGISVDIQLDGGADFGISGGADDVTLFSGITLRL